MEGQQNAGNPKAALAKKLLLRLLLAVALVGVLGFFVLPPILKSVALDQLSRALHRQVSVKSVSINPYTLSVALEGVAIRERESEEVFVGFDRLYLNLESSSLFKRGLVVGELQLVNPKLRIERLPDRRYNFTDLLEESMAQPKSDAPPPLFSLNNIQVTGGVVEFEDRLLKERHVISSLSLSLPFISNMAYALESTVEPSFSAEVNGSPLRLNGKSKPFSETLESELSLDLDGLQISKYLDYAPVALPIQLKSGTVDGHLTLSFKQEHKQPAKLIVAGGVSLQGLNVLESNGDPLIALKRLELELESADLLHSNFLFRRVAVDAPEIQARLNRAGVLNWARLTPQRSGAAREHPSASDKREDSPPVAWSVGELKISSGSLRWLDETRAEPLRLRVDGWDLGLKGLDSKGSPADLLTLMKLNGKGELKLSGRITPMPLLAEVAVEVVNLEVLPFQPLFADKLNVELTRGRINASGDLRLALADSAKGGAMPVSGGFRGKVTVGDFQSVDKINSADLLRWKSLHFGAIDIRLGPDSVSIGDIALADFFARVIVSPEGKLNLMQLVRSDSAPASPSVAEETAGKSAMPSNGKAVSPLATKDAAGNASMPIKIGKVTVQGGNVRFTDNFVKPNYTANLRQIGGQVSGLSTETGSVANLDLRGRYDNVAPLNVTARINPLSASPYLDLSAEIKGVELTSFSSYSGKYAGYAIEKGKLSLFVKYKIEDGQLVAENRVFIDQLTFGDRVESPDATKLPVNLAIALLKNRDGEIDLDLPISGSLNDPQFSVGGLIVKVIVNLFVKAVTSPFALIGSLFGGGEELSNVEFDFGRTLLTVEAQKRLDGLAKALIDRPSLKLEVEGRIDPENDREGLKRASIDQKVRAIKRQDLTKRAVESGAAESLAVSGEEYPKLLERAYRAESFPKPRNMVGMVKTLPVEEMEKLMMAHATISDDDLRELGAARAAAVRDALFERQVPSERVFILPTRWLDTDQKTGSDKPAKGSRADFKLK